MGLEPVVPEDGGGTVGALLEWWLATYRDGEAAYKTERGTVKRHLLASDLRRMTLAAVKPYHVHTFMAAKRAEGLAPQSVNHLRSYLSRAFSHAKEAGRWQGVNPVSEVATLRVPKPNAEYLRENEVRAVLAHVSDRWRDFVAVAIYTGLRRGALAGLRKGDLHLDEGNPRVHVQRSWDRDTTKSGKGRVVPLCAECIPFLRDAVAASPSELVFPRMSGDRRGEMLDPDALDLPNVVRRALADAGVAELAARLPRPGERRRPAGPDGSALHVHRSRCRPGATSLPRSRG